MLEDGWTGRLVSPNDPKWLAGAVETLLDNVRLRVRMATDARAQVESYFGLSRNVARLARLFASAPAEQAHRDVVDASPANRPRLDAQLRCAPGRGLPYQNS